MDVLRWTRVNGGYVASSQYAILRVPYGTRFSFTAMHRGKKCGFDQLSLALAKRDAQQHANGFRGSLAGPDFKEKSDWCYCPVNQEA